MSKQEKEIHIETIWKLCIKMWDDIFDLPGDVCENKANWMKENGFEEILNDCFFCQFAHEEYLKEENHGHMCDFCPAVAVDSKFNCVHLDYNYQTCPKEFKQRLSQLNKKRI